jgi:hypothetical protein
LSVLDGYYDGEVAMAYVGEDSLGVRVCFDVALEGGPEIVTCKHSAEGQYSDSTKDVFALLGLAWPDAMRDLSGAVGKKVRISVKTKAGNRGGSFTNSYIMTGKNTGELKKLETSKVGALVVKLGGTAGPDDEDIPF